MTCLQQHRLFMLGFLPCWLIGKHSQKFKVKMLWSFQDFKVIVAFPLLLLEWLCGFRRIHWRSPIFNTAHHQNVMLSQRVCATSVENENAVPLSAQHLATVGEVHHHPFSEALKLHSLATMQRDVKKRSVRNWHGVSPAFHWLLVCSVAPILYSFSICLNHEVEWGLCCFSAKPCVRSKRSSKCTERWSNHVFVIDPLPVSGRSEPKEALRKPEWLLQLHLLWIDHALILTSVQELSALVKKKVDVSYNHYCISCALELPI